MRNDETRFWFGSAMFAALFSVSLALADGQSRIPMVIANFDYYDTSGELRDQTAQHSARVQAFASLLRKILADRGKYTSLRLNCPRSTCFAGSMTQDELVQSARQTGARLLVYGGIHKMSTLVQWGKVEVVDLAREESLLSRLFSFRGDTDTAFRKAAEFIANTCRTLRPNHDCGSSRSFPVCRQDKEQKPVLLRDVETSANRLAKEPGDSGFCVPERCLA